MKRICALVLAVMCLTASCAFAAEDYTVAEKLYKQLWAGSGFSGTLTASFETPSLSTSQPIVMDADYIYVRPTEENTAEHRLDLVLTDGQKPRSTAHVQLKDEAVSLQSDLLGESWYTFASQQEPSAVQSAMDESTKTLLAATGIPSISHSALSLLSSLATADGLEDAIEPYKTRIDVWIEGYRQDAVLDKLSDGTTTMSVSYAVSPAAIKAEVKQLVLDMLSDARLTNLLSAKLSEDNARLLLSPALRSWYFSVIDAIPLTGDLTISRTVSLKGETINLHLSLPLYDAATGNATLVYDRSRGEGDLPDNNTIRLTAGERVTELTYQEYSSMTGVKVMQGVFASTDSDGETQDLAAAFTLKREESTTLDAEAREVYRIRMELTLRPDEENANALPFQETDAVLDASFKSKELKSAATDMELSFTLADDDTLIELGFSGASRKKWDPEPVPAQRVNVHTLTQEELSSLLPPAALRLTAALADRLVIAQPEAQEAPETVTP